MTATQPALPWVKINLQLTCKTVTSRKLRGVRTSIAPNEAIHLSDAIYIAAKQIAEFYLDATDMPTTDLNREIHKAAEMIGKAEIRED